MQDIDHKLDDALDEALEMTFPASDPIAIATAATEEESNRAAG